MLCIAPIRLEVAIFRPYSMSLRTCETEMRKFGQPSRSGVTDAINCVAKSGGVSAPSGPLFQPASALQAPCRAGSRQSRQCATELRRLKRASTARKRSCKATHKSIPAPVVSMAGPQETSGTCANVVCRERTRSAYIFGAICPRFGKAAALVMPWYDTDAMTQHLAEIARHVDEDAHAVLIMDQAGCQMSNNLVVPENITIMPLPPKSPELNPAENLWLFMRENWLSNRIFKSYDDIVDHCCDAWRKLES